MIRNKSPWGIAFTQHANTFTVPKNNIAQSLSLALGFMLWMPTAFANITIGMIIIISLIESVRYYYQQARRQPIASHTSQLSRLFNALSTHLKSYLNLWRSNPVAGFNILFFLCLLIATFWGLAPYIERFEFAAKYIDMLYVSILLPYFFGARERYRAFIGFIAGGVTVLVLSYSLALGLIPLKWFPLTQADNAVVFKLHITYGWMMSCLVFSCLVISFRLSSKNRLLSWLLGLIAAAATYNLLFMIQGRTGYFSMGILIGYLAFNYYRSHLNLNTFLFGLMAVAVLICITVLTDNPLKNRLSIAQTELSEWNKNKGSETSIGLRLDFYSNTWDIIKKHPLLGVGTGSLGAAYQERIAGSQMIHTKNPHNEYLLMTAQLGLLGFLLIVGLFITIWRSAKHLPQLEMTLARGLLLAFSSGCLFNSFLLDNTEGLFFAWACAVLFGSYKTYTPHT